MRAGCSTSVRSGALWAVFTICAIWGVGLPGARAFDGGGWWPSDFDGDGGVDLLDFAFFQRCFDASTARGAPEAECQDADFDGDGRVAFSDVISFVACLNGPFVLPLCAAPPLPPARTELDVVAGGEFGRAGPAYLCDFSQMVFYEADVRRTRTVLACSASDGQFVDNEAGPNRDVQPWCRTSTHLFGINSGNRRELWRSADGVAWEKAFTSAVGAIRNVWALQNDRVLIFCALGGTRFQPFWSDDAGTAPPNGATFTPAGAVFTGCPIYWSVQQAPHGTIVAATYGGWASQVSGLDDDEIWRSVDNGVTWTRVFRPQDDVIRHFHAVGYHSGTGRWVVDTGDGEGHRFLFVSDDDGQTWSSATPGALTYLPEPHRNAHFESSEPLDWVASSDAISIVRTTAASDLLRLVSNTGAGRVTATPAVAAGDYVALSFTIPETVPPGTHLFLQFDFKTSSPSGLLIPAVFDGANELALSTTYVPNTQGVTAPFTAHFQSGAPGEYQLRLKASAGAVGQGFVVILDNIRVGCGPSPAGQVTRFRDYGHPTRLLCGSDAVSDVMWYDVMDFSFGTVQQVQCKRTGSSPGGSPVFLELFRYGDLWYACSCTTTPATKPGAMILVSPDLEHWAVYHRFSDLTYGVVQYAGYAGGKLHLLVQDAGSRFRHFCISPAAVSLETALLVCPAKTNLVPGPASMGQELWGTFPGASRSLDPNVWLVSSGGSAASMRLSASNVTNVCEGIRSVPGTVPGQTYMAHAWVKGYASRVHLQMGSTADRIYYGLRAGDWTEIWSAPAVVTGTTGSIRLGVYPSCHDARFDVWVGAIELAMCPASPWSSGGVSQPGEVLTFALPLTPEFTHVFSIEIIPDSTEIATGPSTVAYICSYIHDDQNYAQLYYDSSNSTFKLAGVAGGYPAGPIGTASHAFSRGAQAKFAVRMVDGRFRLSVCDGVATEHVEEAMRAGSRILTIRTGRASDGAQVLPHALWGNYVYNFALSDSELSALFGYPSAAEAPPP